MIGVAIVSLIDKALTAFGLGDEAPETEIGINGERQPEETDAAKGGSTVTKTRVTPGRDGATSSITLEKDAAGRTVSRTHTVTKDGQVIHQHQEHIGKYGGERRFPDEWTGTPTINAPPHTPKPPSFPPGSN
jgi:hypothetical protein